MAKNKQPPTVDLEEGLQGTNATSNEPKLVSDQEKEPITGRVDFRMVKAMIPSDKSGSYNAGIIWPSSANVYNNRCIYRVPCGIRCVNPEAYTPQTLLIGPLHHSKKAQADELSKTERRYLEYMKMERHKKKYLENFEQLLGEKIVHEIRRIIKRDEEIIRACYAESTDSIKSDDFVKMMLLDSVFILLFLMQSNIVYMEITGDFVLDEPCHQYIIIEDLLLLENQLPFLLLENLFDAFFKKIIANETRTFHDYILGYFGFEGKLKAEVKFRHFTDLIRCLIVQTLDETEEKQNEGKLLQKAKQQRCLMRLRSTKQKQTDVENSQAAKEVILANQDPQVGSEQRPLGPWMQPLGMSAIPNLRNAEELDSAGVQFVAVKPSTFHRIVNISLVIKFECGSLTMSRFRIEDNTERVLRNIMALEQCHYPYTAFVCNYMSFLDSLIDTVQDVDFLVKKGIIENWLGRSESVAEMVNKMCSGIVDFGSNYFNIAKGLNDYSDSPLNRSFATLRRVYFKDLWTETATVAAAVILILTMIGTVASVIQVKQNEDNPPSPSPPGP